MPIRLNQFKVLYIFSFHEYLYHRHHYFRIRLPWQRYSLFLSSHPCSCTSNRLGTVDNCHCYGTRSGNPLQKRMNLVSKSYKLLSCYYYCKQCEFLKDAAIPARNKYLMCSDVHSSLVCKYRSRCYRNREYHTERRTPPGRNVILQKSSNSTKTSTL